MAKGKIKILLSMPIAGHAHAIVTNNATESIGINILSSALKANGYTTLCCSNKNKEVIMASLNKFRPDYIGLSVTWINIDVCNEISSYVKTTYPETKVIWGGPGVSFDAEITMNKYNCVDVVVIGEGHETIVELVKAKNFFDFEKIKGIVYRTPEKIVSTESRIGIKDLNQIPHSDRSELIQSIINEKNDTARIITSWGCPNTCTFCINDQWTKLCRPDKSKKRLTRNVDEVVVEIKYLHSIGIRKIIFVDEDAIGVSNSDYDRIMDLISKLKQLHLQDITYSIFTTTKSINKFPVLYSEFSKIGLRKVFFGIENLSKTGLKMLGGHTKLSINELDFLYGYLKEKGICPTSGFIFLTPFTTEDEIIENLEFLAKNRTIDISSFSSFLFRKVELYPGTYLYDRFVSSGLHYTSPLVYEFKNKKIEFISEVLDKSWRSIFNQELKLFLLKEKYFFNQLSIDEENIYLKLFDEISNLNLQHISDLLNNLPPHSNSDTIVEEYKGSFLSILNKHISKFQKVPLWTNQQ
jgi:radical SAM superfamily enzyme YgiQ (UPF0313 family)